MRIVGRSHCRRKSIHLHIHFKGLKQSRILHLGRRGAGNISPVVLYNTEGILIPLNFLSEALASLSDIQPQRI